MLSKDLKYQFARLFLFFVIFLTLKILVSAQDSEIVYLEWIDDPTTTSVINWISSSDLNQTLEYRKEGNNWLTIESNVNSIPGTSSNRHKVFLTDLDSGSVYEFRVDGRSSTYSFRTAPENIEEPMSFIVAGDIYSDGVGTLKSGTIDAFITMSENASVYNPYFAVLGGDLAHAGSNVNDVNLWFEFLELWFKNMVTSNNHLIPMVISIGNNDTPGGFGAKPEDLIFINSLFSFPKDQWGNESFNHYGVLDFSDYLSIIMLNTNHSNDIEGDQTEWLEEKLRGRQNIDYVFPIYHVAGWPTFRSFRGIHEDAVRNNWHRLFYENDIRVVFEHHDHIFKMTRALGDCTVPINNQNDCVFDPLGVIYMGGGSWGSPNDREFRDEWYINKASREHNFVLVEITNTRRTFKAIGESSETITSFTDYVKVFPPDEFVITDISTESFEIQWDESEGANKYFLDLAYDQNFELFVEGYQNRNLGSNTKISVNDLPKNLKYYLRVRSENFFDLSDYSNPQEITLVPETPVALKESDLRVTSFTANWTSIPNVSEYELSVSTDSSFSRYASGFNKKIVENITTINVQNLEPDTEYFYKVRAILPPQKSDFSNVIGTKTLGLDDQNSEISSDLNKVLANSEQQAMIQVRLIDENGNPVSETEVSLIQEGVNSTILPDNTNITDFNGEVRFTITGENAGTALYRAFLSNYEIGDGVEIEFQPFPEKAQIGNNFPNPFRNYTRIPLTVPRQMNIHLSIISILGKNIQTILDETRNSGYYEIEFRPNGLASGVYFVRLVSEDGVSLNQVTYTK